MKMGFRLYFHRFWSGIGYGLDGTIRDCRNLFVVSRFQMNKKERVICQFEIDLKKFVVGVLILAN